MTPSSAYDDITADNCYDGSCSDTTAELEVFANLGNPNYDPTNPNHLGQRASSTNGPIWVNASAGTISLNTVQPPGDNWKQVVAQYYYMMVYLHGKDHPREYWAPGKAERRIKAWRYQIDYAGDQGNALADGGGRDNINLLTGFDINLNNPDPQSSDLFIDPDTGVWGVAVKVAAPFSLMTAGPAGLWQELRTAYGAAAFPSGGTPEEILAWQATQPVQLAYRAWRLVTAQFSPGEVRAVAVDQSTCAFRFDTAAYHYYFGTREPSPNRNPRRTCNPNANDIAPDEDVDPTGVIEAGLKYLTNYAAYSNQQVPVVKEFQITLHPFSGNDFIGGGDPPNWVSGKSRGLSLR
ncbi:MAG: hypothetical protein R3D98_08755 [Candidatus Krumholzibacteriia bacterium]